MSQETGPVGLHDAVRLDDDPTTANGGRAGDPTTMTVREERMVVGTRTEQMGRVRASKQVDTEHVEQGVQRAVEQADIEREQGRAGDSGEVETLPDGSLSIPVFEEELVITKRLVVKERVIIRKHTVYTEQQVSAELRRERVEIETEGDVRVVGDTDAGEAGRMVGDTDPVAADRLRGDTDQAGAPHIHQV